jgi:hypothetical protein
MHHNGRSVLTKLLPPFTMFATTLLYTYALVRLFKTDNHVSTGCTKREIEERMVGGPDEAALSVYYFNLWVLKDVGRTVYFGL